MRTGLLRAVDGFERSRSVDALWSGLHDTLISEGFSHCLRLSMAPGRTLEISGREIDDADARDRLARLLNWCCTSYAPCAIGNALADLRGEVPVEMTTRFVTASPGPLPAPATGSGHPGPLGLRRGDGVQPSGISGRHAVCIPVRLQGNDQHAAYLVEWNKSDADFCKAVLHNLDMLQILCLLFERHLFHLGMVDAREPGWKCGLNFTRSLSLREQDVALMLSQGLRRREIAEKLGIRSNTVSSHVKSIYRKLGVNSQVEVMRLYRNEGAVHSMVFEERVPGAGMQ